jgi:hypothetical protein
VVPFNLSVSRPRPLPPPENIPPPAKGQPPPPKREGPTAEERAIAAAKEENKRAVAEKYKNGPQQFRLRTLERPTNLERVREEVESRRQAELNFEGQKAKAPPRPPDAKVRLTASTILREDHVYKVKQEEEAKMLKAYVPRLEPSQPLTQAQAEPPEWPS